MNVITVDWHKIIDEYDKASPISKSIFHFLSQNPETYYTIKQLSKELEYAPRQIAGSLRAYPRENTEIIDRNNSKEGIVIAMNRDVAFWVYALRNAG